MVITDETIQVDRTSSNTPSNAPPRWPFRRLLGIGTAIVVAAIALVVIVESSGPTSSDQTPEPAPRTHDEIVRDLVVRGLVPAATLDDGTQIISPALAPAPRTRDEIVRDLVARGLVPAATLDDRTQIISPALAP